MGFLDEQTEKLTWSIIKKLTQAVRRIGFFKCIGQKFPSGSSGAVTVPAG